MGQRVDPAARFQRLRKEAKQEIQADVGQAQEAMKRRFAKLGLTGSGAQIKAQQQVEAEAGKRKDLALGRIASAEEQEALRRREIQEGREFARGEREASQSFAAEQAGLGREFQRGERLGSQAFASGQADLQRRFSAGEAAINREFQSEMETRASKRFYDQLDQAAEQFERQFNLDELVTKFNMDMAQAAQDKKGLFEQAGGVFSSGEFGGAFAGSQFGGGAIAGGILGGAGGGGLGQAVGSIATQPLQTITGGGK
jgi:hypothetical protein